MMRITHSLLTIAGLGMLAQSAVWAEDGGCTGSGSTGPGVVWKYGWQDKNRNNTLGSPGNAPLPAAASAPASGYTPSQIAQAYGFNLIANKGSNQVIAIVDAYGSPTLQADLNAFCTQYGLPPATVSFSYPVGKPTTNNAGWALETTLDVEWAHALAPAASIVVVVSPDNSLNSLLACARSAAANLKANVVSMSWGAAEFANESAYDAYFNYPATRFVASSGDSGAGVNWPGVSTNVLSVGGTSLILSNNSVAAETGWSGSGGGTSRYEPTPAYQRGFSSVYRSVPDVSFLADPYTGVSVYYNGGWYVAGGTSLGAPCWAALLALRAADGNAGTNSLQSTLYPAAGTNSSGTNYAALLRDITSGTNGIYGARAGYDLVTGLGSPKASTLALLPATNSASTGGSSSGSSGGTTPASPKTPGMSRLTAAQLPAAIALMNTLNRGFAADESARRPGGGAFLTDGQSILDPVAASRSVNAGGSVFLDFYARVKNQSQLSVNTSVWPTLGALPFQATSLLLQDAAGVYPVYQINLN